MEFSYLELNRLMDIYFGIDPEKLEYTDYFICQKIISAMDFILENDSRVVPKARVRKLYDLVKKFEKDY